MLNIALYRPEIPPNTGNIARLCVAIHAHLHIVGAPSFDMSEKAVRRAGLDYWEYLALSMHTDWEAFVKTVPDFSRIFAVTKFGQTNYSEIGYLENDYLLFGQETAGLPLEIRNSISESRKVHIPMSPECRSINLSNSVAIVAYEAVRQLKMNFIKK